MFTEKLMKKTKFISSHFLLYSEKKEEDKEVKLYHSVLQLIQKFAFQFGHQ